MRGSVVLPLSLAVAACAHAPARFEPALPDQAVPGQPGAAGAEVQGVRMVATAGGWSGWPEDLEDTLTPVEVLVDNHSGRALRIRHEGFALVDPGGFRHAALPPQEVQRRLAAFGRPAGYVWFHYGFYGAYPWPGFYYPWHYRRYYYPYAWWWGWPGAGIATWVPPAPPAPAAGPEGALEDGGRVSVLLFFPVPAAALGRLDLVADLVAESDGRSFGTIRLSFVRAGAEPRAPPAPPTPPPAGPPPPPPAPEKPR